jgi:hypothetical protein
MTTTHTSIKPSTKNDGSVSIVDRFWPLAMAAISAPVLLRYANDFFRVSKENSWHVDNLYISVFGVFTVMAPFLFAYYTFVKTIDNKYITAVRDSFYFRSAERYIIRATVTTFFAALVTIPLLIMVPEPEEPGRELWLVVGWGTFSVYAVSMVMRSLYHFAAILEVSQASRFKY